MNRDDMHQILKRFSTIYDNFKYKDEALDVWAEIFENYDSSDVEKAASRVIETCNCAPKPCDLLGAIKFVKGSNKVPSFQCTDEEKRQYRDYLATKGIRVLPDGQYAKEYNETIPDEEAYNRIYPISFIKDSFVLSLATIL